MNRITMRQAVVLVLSLSLLIPIAACSEPIAEFPGLSEATLACSQSLDPATINPQIVPIGMLIRTVGDVPPEELPDLVLVAQERAILAATAASLSDYWQPLADAWSIHEALLRSIEASPPTEDVESDPTLEATVPPKVPDSEFLRNVNVDFAAITKDTYCRIAFTKSDLRIVYLVSE
jgi:hypothetical protein